MKTQLSDDLGRHRGITYHRMPVAGVGGLLLVVAVLLIVIWRLPDVREFLILSIPAGVLALGIIRWIHKLRPKTEEAEVQLDVGHQTRQP
jgi:hypothetical protein